MTKKYDVIVAGGGTAGCACAYIAGKLGLNVLLIEKNTYLGGTMTSSLVIPAMKTSSNAINTDFFDTLHKNLKIKNGAITYSDGNKGWFNPELTKIVLEEMLLDVNVDIKLESEICEIKKILSGYNVTIHVNNIICENKELLIHIDTRYLIDATGDAKICKKLNFEFLNNNEKFLHQPMNLRFIMSGVNTKEFAQWLMKYDSDRDVSTSCTADGYTYLSTAYTWDNDKKWALKPLFEDAIANKIVTEEDSNYFQLFSVAGTSDSIAFNAPRLIYKSLTNTDAYIKARASIYRLSRFCKIYLPGFKHAHISSIADKLGIRVSNRVKCKYVYTKEDLVSGKKFSNPVVISNYPIDIHSDKQNGSKLEKVMQEYQLPIESLMVDNNTFVIGRCLSADFEAQAALRIIPSCFSMGEGVAKYIAGIINPQNC